MDTRGHAPTNAPAILDRVRTVVARIADRASLPIMVLSALGILLFTVLKAHYGSFTHDESLTWARYVQLDLKVLLEHRENYTNNHMLNSILMKFSQAMFGSGELALRLPNVLALVVYLVYGALLCRGLGATIGTLTFVLLCYGSQFMELFALARGYGLSYGFLFMAMFHAWRAAASWHIVHPILLHVALVLMVLSSFVTAQLALALVAALPLIIALADGTTGMKRRRIVAHAVLSLCALVLVWEPLRKVMNGNSFDFGGDSGFVLDTFGTLVVTALPSIRVDDRMVHWTWMIFMIVAAMVVWKTFLVFRKRAQLAGRGPSHLLMLVWSTLLGTMLVIVVQHAVLGTPYPEARFCKFLYPVLLLGLGVAFKELLTGRWILLSILVLGWAVFAQVKAFISLSGFNTSVEWQYDMDTERIMDAIKADLSRRPDDAPIARIGHPWVLEPTINFYRVTKNIPVAEAHRLGPSFNEDFLILNDTLAAQGALRAYRFVHRYEHAHLDLYQRTGP